MTRLGSTPPPPPSPTHPPMLSHKQLGDLVQSYQYYEPSTRDLDFPKFCEELRRMPEG
jgi:hypothetical protein